MASKTKQTGRAKSSKPSGSADLEALRKQNQALKTEVQLLRNNFDRSKIPKELIESQDMAAMFQESYMQAVEEINKLKEEKGIGSDQQDLQEKLRKAKQELGDSEKKRKFAEEDVHVMKTRVVVLEEENRKLKNSANTSKPSTPNEENELTPKVQELTAENDKLRKELMGVSDDVGQLQEKYKQLTAELASKSSELYTEQKRTQELQEKVNEQSKKLETETRKYEDERKEFQRRMYSLEDKLSILSNTNNGEDDQKDALLKQLDEIKRDQDSEIKLLRKELESKMDLETAVNKMKKELSDKNDLEDTIDKLNKEKINQTEMIESLKVETDNLQTRILQLENAAKSSNVPGTDEDSSRLRTMIQELQRELDTVKSERDNAKMQVKQHKNDLHDAFVQIEKKEKEMKSTEAKQKELIERKEKTIDKLRRENSIVDPTGGKPTKEVQELTKQVQTLKEENEALHSRVSQLAGAKLQDSNPGITNLSDDNRPTKVGEKFAELYDNEWTEAFEEQEETTGDEKGTIEYLYKLLLDIYSFCQSLARKHAESLQKICTALSGTSANSSKIPEIHLVQKKLLKDVLKSFASFQVNDVVQNFFDTNKSFSRSASKTADFINRAVEICWYMALQDPPMMIDKSIKSSDSFDTDIFKVYTKKGAKIDYIVWPPLLLHEDGPLVGKGVAQGK